LAHRTTKGDAAAMTDWEQEKRDAQLAFINPGDSLEEAHESVDRFYIQLLAKGYVEPFLGNDSPTQRAIDADLREQDIKEADVDRSVEQEQDLDIEPER
jgi:hypothetical protein